MASQFPQECLPGQVFDATQESSIVTAQRKLAEGTYAIRLQAEGISSKIKPGQFFMIRPDAGTDPLLGRPFALYDTVLNEDGKPTEFEFAYHVIGKMTSLMSDWQVGQQVQLWGPLGNGFPLFQGRHLLCVGGGIGYTPFLAVARETLGIRRYGRDESRYQAATPAERVTLCYGSQSKSVRADLCDFDDLKNFEVQISTDDGSEGHHGLVTDLVAQAFSLADDQRPDGVYCCGPEPMMHAVAKQCAEANIPCWLSLETPMACGFGACFSCVTKVNTGNGEWDYQRTCVEGPIFPAEVLETN